MRILALNPYHGGSHQAFLEGWIAHSQHEFDLLTLPAYKWKWRMRHAAVTFAEQLAHSDRRGELAQRSRHNTRGRSRQLEWIAPCGTVATTRDQAADLLIWLTKRRQHVTITNGSSAIYLIQISGAAANSHSILKRRRLVCYVIGE